jgi:HEAT repeat protein
MTGLRFVSALLFGIFVSWPALVMADRVEDWVGKLSSPNPSERREAAVSLGRSGDPRAVPPLVKLLRDPEPMVRLDASGALIEIGKPSVSPLLAGIQKEKDPVFLWNAIRVLEDIGDDRAIGPLKSLKLKHPDESIREIAEYSLDSLLEGKKRRSK